MEATRASSSDALKGQGLMLLPFSAQVPHYSELPVGQSFPHALLAEVPFSLILKDKVVIDPDIVPDAVFLGQAFFSQSNTVLQRAANLRVSIVAALWNGYERCMEFEQK